MQQTSDQQVGMDIHLTDGLVDFPGLCVVFLSDVFQLGHAHPLDFLFCGCFDLSPNDRLLLVEGVSQLLQPVLAFRTEVSGVLVPGFLLGLIM